MDKIETIIIALIFVGSLIVATAPFSLFPNHNEIAAGVGVAGLAWMLFAIVDRLRGYRIQITRK